MSQINPYSSNDDDEIDDSPVADGEHELASPWVRLGAVLLDGIILMIPCWIIILVVLNAGFNINYIDGQLKSLEDQLIIAATMCASIIFVYPIFNAHLLSKNGQSIGKMACKIRIVKDDGSIPSLMDSLFKRYIINTILQSILFIGPLYALIDSLLIFRGSRKCLHDDMAGTLVVYDKKKHRKAIDSDIEDEDIEDEDIEEEDDEDDVEEEIGRGMAMILPVGRSGWAIASGYLALFSILIFPAPLALLTGILGVMEIRRNPKKMGMGRAIFGIVMGGLGTVLLLIFLGALAVEQMRRKGLL